MSHNSVYQANIRRLDVLQKAVEDQGGTYRQAETVKLYGQNQVKAVAEISLPGWQHRIAITNKGEFIYDNFGAQQGSMETLHRVVQDYNLAVTTERVETEQLLDEAVESYWIEEQPNGDKVLVVDYVE